MRLLLDTDVLLWWRVESPRLPARVSDQIRDPDNDIVISIISFWEIVVKKELGKVRFLEDFEAVMADEQFELLTVTHAVLPAASAWLIQDRSRTVFPLPGEADTTVTRADAPSRSNSLGRETMPPTVSWAATARPDCPQDR